MIFPFLNRQTRCCCFHFGRCGSTLLGDMLNGHNEAQWHGELFHPLISKPDELGWLDDPFDLLNNRLKKNKAKTFGFETKFQHLAPKGLNLDLPAFVEKLKQSKFEKFILLRRNNYLRQAISVERGRQAGQWHYSSDQPKPKFSPVALDLQAIKLSGKNRELIECFEYMDQTYDAAKTYLDSNCDWLNLQYEVDLERDPKIGFEKARLFLELSESQPTVTVRKLGGRPIAEMILNEPEVRERLDKTPYQWMLD